MSGDSTGTGWKVFAESLFNLRALMDALDLTKRPPRSPREPLDDLNVLMMARTVDKLRATLPGGNTGSYQVPGLSARLLEALELPEHDLRDAVARAASDEDVARWIAERTDSKEYPQINAMLESRTVGHRRGDAAFEAKYPQAATMAADTKLIDMLVLDDRDAFPNGSTS